MIVLVCMFLNENLDSMRASKSPERLAEKRSIQPRVREMMLLKTKSTRNKFLFLVSKKIADDHQVCLKRLDQ